MKKIKYFKRIYVSEVTYSVEALGFYGDIYHYYCNGDDELSFLLSLVREHHAKLLKVEYLSGTFVLRNNLKKEKKNGK